MMLNIIFNFFIFPDTITKLNIPGEPELPVLRFFIEETTGIKIDIIYRDSLLKDKIMPKQYPLRKDGLRRDFIISETYKKDIFFPEKIYEAKKIGRRNKKDIYLLEIYTHRYNPYRNILLYPEEIKLSPLKLFNFKKQNNKILFIFNMSFLNKIRKLVVYRKLQGYEVDTLIVEPSTDTSTIRNLINFKDPDYTVIIGDISNVKTYVTLGDYDGSTVYTDLYFGIEDTGFIPDRITGRISVKDTVEISDFIEKVIRYETSELEYLNKAYFISSDDFWHHQLTEQTHRYSMDTLRARGYVCDSLWGYYNTGTPIDSAFTNGRNLIVYSGHGSELGWLGPTFYISNLDNIKEQDKYGFVFNFACRTGNFSYPECFTEALLRRRNKGAILTYGSSTYSYWEEDDILQKRIIDLYKKGEIISNVIDSAMILFLKFFGIVPIVKQYFKQYNIFGDPLIKIRDEKEIPIISNIPKYFPKSNTLSLNVEDKSGIIPFRIGFEQNLLFRFDSGIGKIDVNFDYFDTGFVNYYLSSPNHIPKFSRFKLIPDGSYLKTDFFFIFRDSIKIKLRNFGNRTFMNGFVILKPVTQNLIFLTDSFFFDSIRPFSDTLIKSRFILLSYVDTTIMYVYISSDSFSIIDTIIFNLPTPEIEILVDTFFLYKNRKNRFSFNIRNNSIFNIKNIYLKLSGNDVVFDSSNFFIDSLSQNSSMQIVTYLYIKDIESDTIGIFLDFQSTYFNKQYNIVLNLRNEAQLPPHTLFSNISNGELIFITEAGNVQYDVNLKYYDIGGRKLREVNIQKVGNIVDKVNFKSGIYFVHYSSSKNNWLKKIIILK